MFHWFEDCYLDYCTEIPILRDIAQDNELHHYFPRSILSYTYLEHSTYTLPMFLFVFLILYILFPFLFVEYPYGMATCFFFLVTGNVIHRFSHMRDCENYTFVIFLQKCGIFCSHEHHSLHHSLIGKRYCAICPCNNYLLDYILFWRGLEYIIYLMIGVKPSRKGSYEEYSSIHNHMHENAKLVCPDKPTPEDVKELKVRLKEYIKCNPSVNSL